MGKRRVKDKKKLKNKWKKSVNKIRRMEKKLNHIKSPNKGFFSLNQINKQKPSSSCPEVWIYSEAEKRSETTRRRSLF